MKKLVITLALCFFSSLVFADKGDRAIYTFAPKYPYDNAVTFDHTDKFGKTENLQLWARPDDKNPGQCIVDCAGNSLLNNSYLRGTGAAMACLASTFAGGFVKDKPGNSDFIDLYNKMTTCSIDNNKKITWPFYDEVKQAKTISYQLTKEGHGVVSVTRIK